jgi:hypothetical protein
VANADKKYGELDGDGMLWDVGVVVEDVMVLDKLHEAVKHVW